MLRAGIQEEPGGGEPFCRGSCQLLCPLPQNSWVAFLCGLLSILVWWTAGDSRLWFEAPLRLTPGSLQGQCQAQAPSRVPSLLTQQPQSCAPLQGQISGSSVRRSRCSARDGHVTKLFTPRETHTHRPAKPAGTGSWPQTPMRAH